MKTFILHFVIYHGFINFIVSEKNELPIYDFVNDLSSVGRYEAHGKYNPDIDLNTGQIIQRYGYPSEAHLVTTEDGYLLTMHRIVGKSKSHPVLLQHGMICSSVHWVLNGPKQALAFKLADHGYDVWFGNFRGNTYSRTHTTLSTNDAKFWDFSWHEMGIYDLPAMISYITNLKQSNLTYIGHSMGTTTFFVMSSLRPDISSKVKMMYALGPTVYMGNIKSPVRFFAHFSNDFQFLKLLFRNDEFLLNSSLLRYLLKNGCDSTSMGVAVCKNIIFLIAGFDEAQMDTTLLPVIMSHTPAGTSIKTLIHYLQEVKSAKFMQFDYGAWKNIQMYNSTTPPEYDISKVSVPVALYYSKNDWLADSEDAYKLSEKLNNVVDMYEIPFEKFNHADFLWAIDAPKLVYSRILSTMNEV